MIANNSSQELNRNASEGMWKNDPCHHMHPHGVMSDLRELAIDLLEQIDLNSGRAAVVAFNSAAQLISHLSGDRDALYHGIRGLVASGGTRIDLGLEAAEEDVGVAGAEESVDV